MVVDLLLMYVHHIDVFMHEGLGEEDWRCTGFYGWLEIQNHHLSWSLFFMTESDLPWPCIGDFNEILLMTEKRGVTIEKSGRCRIFGGWWMFVVSMILICQGMNLLIIMGESWMKMFNADLTGPFVRVLGYLCFRIVICGTWIANGWITPRLSLLCGKEWKAFSWGRYRLVLNSCEPWRESVRR